MRLTHALESTSLHFVTGKNTLPTKHLRTWSEKKSASHRKRRAQIIGLALAHQHPDGGVLVRLSGEGTPHNLPRITGSRLATEEDALRQAQQPEDEPLPFIAPEDEKKQAELDKAARDVAALPDDEKVRLAAEAARGGQAKDPLEPDGKTLTEAAGRMPDRDAPWLDSAVKQVALQERSATRLQQMEREIVIEKTFGE